MPQGGLFSDAELGEDTADDFVGGDGAGDLAEEIESVSEFGGEEFGMMVGGVVVFGEGVGAVEREVELGEDFAMALVEDGAVGAGGFGGFEDLENFCSEAVEAFAGFCGDEEGVGEGFDGGFGEVGFVENLDGRDAFGAFGGVSAFAGDVGGFDVEDEVGSGEGVLARGVHLG